MTRLIGHFFIAAVVALLCLCFRAEAAPAFDVQRIAVAGGVSYDWYAGSVPQEFGHKNEPCVNGFAAYDATQHFAATAAVAYGVSNKMVTVYPGAHYRLGVGKEDFALGLAYAFYGGQSVPKTANEWVASVIYNRPLGQYLSLSGSETLGFDTKLARTSVQLTFPFFVGKDRP